MIHHPLPTNIAECCRYMQMKEDYISSGGGFCSWTICCMHKANTDFELFWCKTWKWWILLSWCIYDLLIDQSGGFIMNVFALTISFSESHWLYDWPKLWWNWHSLSAYTNHASKSGFPHFTVFQSMTHLGKYYVIISLCPETRGYFVSFKLLIVWLPKKGPACHDYWGCWQWLVGRLDWSIRLLESLLVIAMSLSCWLAYPSSNANRCVLIQTSSVLVPGVLDES